MLFYNLSPKVEAFSTHIPDSVDFKIILPQHQAHGTSSVIVNPYTKTEETFGVDALITQVPGLRIGVKTADCVPILLYDETSGTIAAIHSGWKGTLANIISKVLRRLVNECGINASASKAIIGPCIHQEAFEVGDDLAESFMQNGYHRFCKRMFRFGTSENEQWHIDLPGICKQQLVDCNVENIEIRDECTFSLYNEFYSARRLGKNFGKQRIINAICLKR